MTPTTSYNYGFLNVCYLYNYSIHAVFSATGRSATPPLQAQKLADLVLEIPVQGWAANQTANSEATKMLGHRLQIARVLNWVVETSRYPLTSKPPRLERGIPQKSWRNVPVSIDAAMAAEEDAAMAECVCV